MSGVRANEGGALCSARGTFLGLEHLLVDLGELLASEGEQLGVLEGLAEVGFGFAEFGLALGDLLLIAVGVATVSGDALSHCGALSQFVRRGVRSMTTPS